MAAGIGITLVPRMALEVEDRPERRLRFLPFQRPLPARTICFAWRRGSPRSAEFRLFGAGFVGA